MIFYSGVNVQFHYRKKKGETFMLKVGTIPDSQISITNFYDNLGDETSNVSLSHIMLFFKTAWF